ncbi:MAG: hypothetical protein Q4A07_00490 [Coriobacteriales bacterium]|nr:hypothetical protein [Coriobacteriales bacterium]
MDNQQLSHGTNYGLAYEGVTSVDALMKTIQALDKYDIDNLLVLPYRVNDNPATLTTRLNALSLECFHGVVVVSLLGVSCTDDALFACLNLRDALDCPELTVAVAASSERKAELAKALAIAGFSELPAQSPAKRKGD